MFKLCYNKIMICANCHSTIGSGASYCNVCGCNGGAISEGDGKIKRLFDSVSESNKFLGYILLALMFIPMVISGIICDIFSIDTTGPVTIGIIIFIVFLFFCFAGFFFHKYIRLQKMKNDPNVIVTVGQIVDFKNIKAQIPYYYPIVEYKIGDKTFRLVYKYNIGADPESISNKLCGGADVDILCSANNPFDATVFYEKKYIELTAVFLFLSSFVAAALIFLIAKGLLII